MAISSSSLDREPGELVVMETLSLPDVLISGSVKSTAVEAGGVAIGEYGVDVLRGCQYGSRILHRHTFISIMA